MLHIKITRKNLESFLIERFPNMKETIKRASLKDLVEAYQKIK